MKERRDAGIDRLRKSQTANEFVIWEVLPWRPKSVRPVELSPGLMLASTMHAGNFSLPPATADICKDQRFILGTPAALSRPAIRRLRMVRGRLPPDPAPLTLRRRTPKFVSRFASGPPAF